MARSKEESKFLTPCALWPVELKLTHIDCRPDDTLVHFQGQYMSICELDYNILQVEIQNAVKTKASVQLGELCLVEDLQSGRWYRGRVQNKEKDLFHVFLLDRGDVLTVGPDHVCMISDTLLMLPPKIVCGFFANILPVQKQWNSLTENYFSSLIGSQISGYIHARLPYHVLILEVPDIKSDLLKLKLARHVDTSTFLLLVEMLIEVPIKQSNASVPDVLIEKQMGREYCLKSSNLPGFEEILSLNGPKLKVGQKVETVVTAAVNSDLFYCGLTQSFELQEQAFRCSLNQIEPVGGHAWSVGDFMSEDSSEMMCQINSRCYEQESLFNVVNIRKPFRQATANLLEKGVAVEMQTPTSSVYPRSFVYSSFNVSSGSEELVYVTSISSPWEIYFHLDRNTDIIDKLMKRVAEESQLLSTTSEDCSGNVCLAQNFRDGQWYRALTQPVQSPKHVSVFFVDHGDKQISEKMNVMLIPRWAVELLMTPMQALRCSLYDIPEGEHLPEVNAWLETAVLNRSLQAKIVTRDNSGHFVCDLYDGNVHVNEKVKDLMATYGVKGCDSSVEPTSEFQDADVGSSSKERSRKTVNPGSKQTSKPMKPPKTEQKNTVTKNVPNKGTLQVSVSPKVNLPKLSNLPDTKMKPGSKGVGFISHCGSGRFFIQMEDDETRILQMCEELNSPVFKDNMKRVTSELKLGDLVAAEYEEDMALYRAVVTKVLTSDQLHVECIDYGNTATIDKKNIHLLTNEFLSQPRLSTPCVLAKSHSLQNDEVFIKEAVGKTLMVEYVQKHGCSWKVNIRILEGDGEQRKDAALPLQDKSPTVSQNEKCDVRMLQVKSEEPVQQKNKSVVQKSKCELKNTQTSATKQKIKATYVKTFDENVKTVSKPGQKSDAATKTAKIAQEHVSTSNANASETSPRCATLSQTNVKENKPMNNLKELLVDYLASLEACTESSVNNADQTRTLSHAPVQMNTDYKGSAAAVITPAEFYVILEDHLLILETVLENLQEVMVPFPDAHLIPGACCLVKMSEKEKWCRAELVRCDITSVLINLVDYGQYTVLSQQEVSQLKQLPKDLAGLPKITYHCLLRGVKPNGQDWSDEAVIFFQSCMCQRNLTICFRQHVSETQWEVDITTGNQNLAKLLVDAGHAIYIDSMLGIQFSQQEMEITEQAREAERHLKEALLKMNASDESMFDGNQESDGDQDATDHLNNSGDLGPVEAKLTSPSDIKPCALM